jgi:hypothetical protein
VGTVSVSLIEARPVSQPLDTHQRTLAINLDPSTFGTFADDGMRLHPPLGHLLSYLSEAGWIEALPMQIPH